jgi:hypothetical protein
VNAKWTDDGLLNAMRAAGFAQAQLREIGATLEDVFVTLTEEESRARGEPVSRASLQPPKTATERA